MRSRKLLVLGALAGLAGAVEYHLSAERMRADVKYLASDQLEGRGVGTNGEKLATTYLADQLKQAGAEPAGDNGSWFQRVPLVGSQTAPDAKLDIEGGGKNFSLHFLSDFVGTAYSQEPENDFDAEAVFVGHGISAPEYGWDDYKGQDLHGKVLVYFTNEPPSTDPKFFGGRALTYYGRWTYKFEEAARRGAVAALIIHTTPTAGYGWNVVKGSFSREMPELKREPGKPALELAAWLTEDAGAKLISSTGKTVDQLLALANEKSFRPMPLGVSVRGHIPVKLREIDSRNVIGKIEGSDPQLKSQVVIYSAHWDHLGVGVPVNGDRIYNGAVDNATGCAVVLDLARAWAALSPKPRRSALFLFVTAEESGLLGSEYYGEHPVVPARLTAVDINYDALYPFGKTSDVLVSGAERTTLWPLVERDAKAMHLAIAPDPTPEQGHYYRSDHFSLARVGVPAFSVSQGPHYIGKPADFGKTIFEKYNAEHYHQPSDEYRPDWDFSGMEQMAAFGMRIGIDVANAGQLPTWHAGDEFLRAREQSQKQ
ncbi:MAG TPA: M28 family peptidase [Bryobacteraceae bacterium]|jgi:Zn-dependent M28 family amino/carboxypeptidase|nr:M28 family peptidase [Bryobacteraceae bacterium]